MNQRLNLIIQFKDECFCFRNGEIRKAYNGSIRKLLDAIDEFHRHHTKGAQYFLNFTVTLSLLFISGEKLPPLLFIDVVQKELDIDLIHGILIQVAAIGSCRDIL